ncbi:MAG TPA: hypothetical protein VI731_12320 [Bacteroidia bacterium]|nr:hypothetical protein [Bacteroidia bacterium]
MSKQQINKLILLVLVISITLTACTNFVLRIYGMKSIKAVNEKTILKYGAKYQIPQEDSYEMDTAYMTYLFSRDTSVYPSEIKNHYQPLQALYYNKSGELVSFLVNCDVGGFPNLAWDRYGSFTTFPPKPVTPLDSLVPVDMQFKYLRPLAKTKTFSADSLDYVVIVYWSRFMGRQSKRLIHFVQENKKLAAGKNVKIIYANTDNLFAREE